jgi:cytochrome c oxidase subunit 6b
MGAHDVIFCHNLTNNLSIVITFNRYCYQSYVDFHRCRRVKGEDYSPCEYFKKVYKSMCPNAWVEKWDTQVAEDRFPGRL